MVRLSSFAVYSKVSREFQKRHSPPPSPAADRPMMMTTATTRPEIIVVAVDPKAPSPMPTQVSGLSAVHAV